MFTCILCIKSFTYGKPIENESEHFLTLNITEFAPKENHPKTMTSAEALVMPDSPHKSCTCDIKWVPEYNLHGYPRKYMIAELINDNDVKKCDSVKRNILLIVKGNDTVYQLKKVLISVSWILKPDAIRECTIDFVKE